MHRHIMIVAAASLVVGGCSKEGGTVTSPRVDAPRAAKAPPPPPAPNVTSTVFDADVSGTPLLTRSDDFNGSGSASYTAVNNVTSHITSDGSWQLYLGSQSARRLYLVLAGQGIPLPDGYYSANVEAYSQCFDQAGNQVSILSMSAGATNGNCSFGLDFSAGRTKYKLVMSPIFAGTGRASVTCNAATGGQCTSWGIVPNVAAANAGVANLYHFANNGARVLDGVYRNSYSIIATQ